VRATFSANGNGGGSRSFAVPSATKGKHYVVAKGGSSGAKPRATFTVTPGLSLSPRSGSAGTSVKATLRGFAAGETITVKWFTGTTPSTKTLKSNLVASSAGSASFSFTVPNGPGGSHKVEATGSTGSKASSTFSVVATTQSVKPTATATPKTTPSPTAVPATATATATMQSTAEPTETATVEPTQTATEQPTATPTEEATVEATATSAPEESGEALPDEGGATPAGG
jgi:hypothetical protein